MVKPQHVVFIPSQDGGGAIATELRLGEATYTLQWPVQSATDAVQADVRALQVSLEQLQIRDGPSGAEVQIHLALAGHRFITALRPVGQSEDLSSALTRLLQDAGTESMERLTAVLQALSDSGTAARQQIDPIPSAARSSPDADNTMRIERVPRTEPDPSSQRGEKVKQ